jgi:hypothetical protein
MAEKNENAEPTEAASSVDGEAATDGPGDEFLKAFDEFADKPSSNDDSEPTAEASASNNEAGEGDAVGEGEPEPTAEAYSGKAPTSEGKTTPAADAGVDGKNIWAGASPEQLAARDALKGTADAATQNQKSDRGRIAAYQRKIDTLEAAAQNPAAATDPDAKPSAFLESDEWKGFEEEYEDVAAPMKAALLATQSQLDAVRTELNGISGDRSEAYLEAQYGIVLEQHPDYEEVRESREFFDWLEGAPPYVRNAALKNGENIVDGVEVVGLVQQYKDSPVYTDAHKGKPGLSKNRQARLDSAPAVDGGGAGASSGPGNDFEQAFAFHAKKAEKEMAAEARNR